ncbi:MAG: hypothetical protein JO040_11760, partial [Gemmatimonadetes bacterium]|nr:hypothetical protein [Gemmatimonadota bacterium]
MRSQAVPAKGAEYEQYYSGADVRQALDEAVRRGWLDVSRRGIRVFVLMLMDVLTALGAASTLLSLRSSAWPAAFGSASASWSTFVMAACIQPLGLIATGAYRSGKRRVSLTRITIGLLLGVAATGLQAYLAGGLQPPIRTEVLGLFAYVVWASLAIFAVRMLIDRGVSFAYSLGIGRRRALVVGSAADSATIAELLRDRNAADLQVMGRLSPTHEREPGAIQTIADIDLALESTGAREVIVASSKLSFEALETLIHRCMQQGAVVSLAPKTLHLMGMQFELRQVRGGTFLRLQP